jgi:Domain of unknown function (DUF1998)
MSVENPIRRGQLIAPFGVGATVVGKSGTAMVTAALDYWYRRETGGDPSTNSLTEFRVEEWRLQQKLQVSHFRIPPDWRESQSGQAVPNAWLPVPFLKFPTWYSCRKCGLMVKSEPTDRQVPKCANCDKQGWFGRMVQVPIVAICGAGHLMEFPWREWVHRGADPTCDRPMRLVAMGGATLASRFVKCECGKGRNLSGVTSANPTGTTMLTDTLGAAPYICSGVRAWVGVTESAECGQPVQGALRNALNVYYADVQSSIYLPIGSGSVPSQLTDTIEGKVRELSGVLDGFAAEEQAVVQQIARQLIRWFPTLEDTYGATVIEKAVRMIRHPEEASEGVDLQFSDEMVFRHEEHLALREQRDSSELLTKVKEITDYGRLTPYLAGLTLVEKLKETRVLNGFTRLQPPSAADDITARQALMWLQPPAREDSWLPAQVVYGEGLYLTLDEQRVAEWEVRLEVVARIKTLAERAAQLPRPPARPPTPRLVLLHTLSHLLMNRLTFTCGYSSATLRERLYSSEDEGTRMAGVLIYTAEGDSDGTLGGLVRMGHPGNFTSMFEQAILEASMCSADPVCMEAGDKGGQGPGSMNLAACHSCALVPETACEEFNRFLDRGLVVGTPGHAELGFFSPLLTQV